VRDSLHEGLHTSRKLGCAPWLKRLPRSVWFTMFRVVNYITIVLLITLVKSFIRDLRSPGILHGVS
jgi:hypothetical protein